MPVQLVGPNEGRERSDIELVDLVLGAAPGSFEAFYQQYKRLIYHCIRARADQVDVDDLLQSFFERLIEGDYRILYLWQRGTSLPIYLSKVVRNFVFDFYRAKGVRKKAADEFSRVILIDEPRVKEGVLSGAPLRAEGITTALELKELRRLGLRAWATLEKRDRFLICGRLHRELSNEAMAKRLGLSEGALRTALSRAQGRLLASLKPLAPEYY
jgi:RNA polymerase sigma factor (sigma-70 family)